MSTRATITVSDQHDSFDIYQHHDGYPDGSYGLVRHISMAQRLAWDLPRFEAADFSAAIIAVLKDRGGSTYLTKDAKAHSDREYHYQIKPIRDDVATRIRLTITQPSWRKGEPDVEAFSGSIQDAVHKFNTTPDITDHPREWQLLGEVDATLSRATEEINQWFKGTADEDTQNTLDDIEDASRNLLRLRHHLETADPWGAFAAAETVLADPDVAAVKGYTSQARFSIFAAMDAHRRFQRQ